MMVVVVVVVVVSGGGGGHVLRRPSSKFLPFMPQMHLTVLGKRGREEGWKAGKTMKEGLCI